jgi:carbamoyl-phosphate synthase large subunit
VKEGPIARGPERPMNGSVLVTCGGKWVGMVLDLRRAMKAIPQLADGKLIVADREAMTPAGSFADGAELVPPIEDEGYVDAILQICERRGVRVLVPIIDLDVVRLAPHSSRFESIGTAVVAPTTTLAQLCLDKDRFQRFAAVHGLAMPRRFGADELSEAPYPLFYKRPTGFGSLGSGICETPREARDALAASPGLIFEEYVTAPEVSVDAFVSRSGRCIVRVQRERDKVVGGESWRSHTIYDPAVADLSQRTMDALVEEGFQGPLNIQVFRTDPPRLIEVNARLGSASVLSNFASADRLFETVLEEACGRTRDGDPDDYIVGVHLYRYLGDLYHDGTKVLGDPSDAR